MALGFNSGGRVLLKFIARIFRSGTGKLVPLPEFPFQLEFVPGRLALAERSSREGRGSTSILMGSPEDITLLKELMETSERTVSEILALAESLDIDAWLLEREKEDAEFYAAMSGPWPTFPPKGMELSVHLGQVGIKHKEQVLLGVFPTGNSWEVPAFLQHGGWNDCPEAHVHVALHRRWSRNFGSDIVSVTNDVVECCVERPPSTREEAMVLAREHFLYCTDIVNQGYGTVEALAAVLLKSKYWHFWWD